MEQFMQSSIDLTIYMQEKGGFFAKYYSIFASTVATYWIVGFFFIHFLFAYRQVTFLYYFSTWAIPTTIVLFLKGSYAHGRPFVIGKEVEALSCNCDYGMPSGHSSMAISGYYVIFHFLTSLIKGSFLLYLNFRKVTKKKVPLVFNSCNSVFVFCIFYSFKQNLLRSS